MDGTSPEMAASAQEKIQEMVRRIVERFHPEKIILFGSYARGTAGPDSDVDLLVVKSVVGPKQQERLNIRLALRGIGLAKDVIVVTPEEVERDKDLVGTIIRPALREGKVLYERTPSRPEAHPAINRRAHNTKPGKPGFENADRWMARWL